jgi:hypothetical protein
MAVYTIRPKLAPSIAVELVEDYPLLPATFPLRQPAPGAGGIGDRSGEERKNRTAGGQLEQIQLLLGHASVQTT